MVKNKCEKLAKLSKSEDIIKVGSILFMNDEEYHIATGSELRSSLASERMALSWQ